MPNMYINIEFQDDNYRISKFFKIMGRNDLKYRIERITNVSSALNHAWRERIDDAVTYVNNEFLKSSANYIINFKQGVNKEIVIDVKYIIE